MPEPPRMSRLTYIIDPTVEWRWNEGFRMRSYQTDAYTRWVKARKGSVIAPTSFGKTVLAAWAIFNLRLPALIFVPTRALIDQWRRMLKTIANIDAGVWYGEEKQMRYVTLTTYQTVALDPRIMEEFAVIIFDEADLATAQTWKRALTEAKRPTHAYVMVITATRPTNPVRASILTSVAPIVYEMSIAEGRELGALAPVTLFPVATQLDAGERTEYDDIQEELTKAIAILGSASPEEWRRIMVSGDPKKRAVAAQAMRLFSQRKMLVSLAVNKDAVAYNIIAEHPGERIMVFSESVEALQRLCRYLESYSIRCGVFIAATSRAERVRLLSEWGTVFQVLLSVHTLERGIDVPAVRIAIILASGLGSRQIVQRVGRILRPQPGKHALMYIVYASGTFEDRLPAIARREVEQARSAQAGTGEFDVD